MAEGQIVKTFDFGQILWPLVDHRGILILVPLPNKSGDRVKVFENLGATVVIAVASVNTYLSKIETPKLN